jgi:hypothetical protein
VFAKLIEYTVIFRRRESLSGLEVSRRRTYTPRQSRFKPITICAGVWGRTVRVSGEKGGCYVIFLMSNVFLYSAVSFQGYVSVGPQNYVVLEPSVSHSSILGQIMNYRSVSTAT